MRRTLFAQVPWLRWRTLASGLWRRVNCSANAAGLTSHRNTVPPLSLANVPALVDQVTVSICGATMHAIGVVGLSAGFPVCGSLQRKTIRNRMNWSFLVSAFHACITTVRSEK